MPTIFDLFGFPLDDRSEKAEKVRKARECPFMSAVCDGGGNRYQTKIKLTSSEPLTSYFNSGIEEVVPGVCSIQAGNDLWVVCPRRLLAARSDGTGVPPVNQALQGYERDLLISAGLPQGVDMGVWAEVSLRQRGVEDADINYHFDYVAAPLVQTTLQQALEKLELTPEQIKDEIKELTAAAKESGYYGKGKKSVAGISAMFPDLTSPFILELMSASTSGSNSEKETDMRSAFRKALLEGEHVSPSINKRQVWGRMVTQLFAKTALAQEWGGQTVWIIQDELLRNIELTTRLRTDAIADASDRNINLVVMHYEIMPEGKRNLSFKNRLVGDAGIDFGGNNTFTDILLPKTAPAKLELMRAMLRRKIEAVINL